MYVGVCGIGVYVYRCTYIGVWCRCVFYVYVCGVYSLGVGGWG